MKVVSKNLVNPLQSLESYAADLHCCLLLTELNASSDSFGFMD